MSDHTCRNLFYQCDIDAVEGELTAAQERIKRLEAVVKAAENLFKTRPEGWNTDGVDELRAALRTEEEK